MSLQFSELEACPFRTPDEDDNEQGLPLRAALRWFSAVRAKSMCARARACWWKLEHEETSSSGPHAEPRGEHNSQQTVHGGQSRFCGSLGDCLPLSGPPTAT